MSQPYQVIKLKESLFYCDAFSLSLFLPFVTGDIKRTRERGERHGAKEQVIGRF